MLTPRMPLYIPCVYITFMYCGAVAAWRLNLPPAAEAAAAGILGEMIYAPYDITGKCTHIAQDIGVVLFC